MKTKEMCSGCRENFYNVNNGLGISECWNYKDAKVVKRWRIGWWTPMDNKENFDKVEVLNCRRNTGSYAYLEELPKHLQHSKKVTR